MMFKHPSDPIKADKNEQVLTLRRTPENNYCFWMHPITLPARLELDDELVFLYADGKYVESFCFITGEIETYGLTEETLPELRRDPSSNELPELQLYFFRFSDFMSLPLSFQSDLFSAKITAKVFAFGVTGCIDFFKDFISQSPQKNLYKQDMVEKLSGVLQEFLEHRIGYQPPYLSNKQLEDKIYPHHFYFGGQTGLTIISLSVIHIEKNDDSTGWSAFADEVAETICCATLPPLPFLSFSETSSGWDSTEAGPSLGPEHTTVRGLADLNANNYFRAVSCYTDMGIRILSFTDKELKLSITDFLLNRACRAERFDNSKIFCMPANTVKDFPNLFLNDVFVTCSFGYWTSAEEYNCYLKNITTAEDGHIRSTWSEPFL